MGESLDGLTTYSTAVSVSSDDIEPTQGSVPTNTLKDEKDSRSYIFSETKSAYTKFRADLAEIGKAMKSLAKDGVGKSLQGYSLGVDAQKRSEITARAKNRAESYVNDFTESLNSELYDPIYEARNEVLNDLGRLPDGKSYATEFAWKWGDPISEKAEIEIGKKKDAYIAVQEEKNNGLLVTNIEILKTVEKDMQEYNTQFEAMLKNEEAFSQFNPALSQEIITSLQPFHQSLTDTEKLLKTQKNALEAVINKQNVGVK